MDIYLNSYGNEISKIGKRFLIKNKDMKKEIFFAEVESIFINESSKITSGAINLALENDIDLILVDKYGNPSGRFWKCSQDKNAKLRRAQLELDISNRGLDLAKIVIRKKIEKMILHLINLRKSNKNDTIINSIEKMTEIKDKLNSSKCYDNLRAREAHASKLYFKALKLFMPTGFHLEGRSYRPAKDEFNATLNYIFGIMYSKLETELFRLGYDINIGFFHVDAYNRKSFVYDIIELYRNIGYISALSIFRSKLIRKGYFEEDEKMGYSISKEGKEIIVERINDNYSKEIQNIRKDLLNLKNILIEGGDFHDDLFL